MEWRPLVLMFHGSLTQPRRESAYLGSKPKSVECTFLSAFGLKLSRHARNAYCQRRDNSRMV